MIPARIEHARHLVALGALALGVLLLLVVPAMASAQTAAVTESPAPAIQEAAPTPGEPAAAEQPAPVEEPAPPPAIEPPAPEPVPPPAPAGDLQPPPPLSPDPAATPAPEATPESTPAIVLPAVPSLPDPARAAGPQKLEATLPAAPAAPEVVPVEPPASPPDAPVAVEPAPGVTDAGPPAALPAHPPAPPRSNFLEALGGVERAGPDPLSPVREMGTGPAGTDADGGNPFDTIAAPGGPAPAGSSLLAVLASYVIPGSGLPTATFLLLVQLAVILAAFYAPRSGLGERIHALGRLGPRLGYRTVLARPG